MGGENPASEQTPLDLENFLPYRLTICAGKVSAALSNVYAYKNLTIPQWRVLATLSRSWPMAARDIARHTHMHKTKVSRAIASLQRRELIKRRKNTADRREDLLELTDIGQRLYGELLPKVGVFNDQLLALLEPEELSALRSAMDKFEKFARPSHNR